jgi:hypothetical protein
MNATLPPSPKARRRLSGVTIVALLWALYNITIIDQALQLVIVDTRFDPSTPEYLALSASTQEWLRLGVPAHMMLNAFITILGFLAMLTAYGLFTAKAWSYIPALAVPALTTVMHGGVAALYSSAPTELSLAHDYSAYVSFTLINLGWTAILLLYLNRRPIKQYIKNSRQQIKQTQQEKTTP